MTHGSLFSGIGGFDLAAAQMGWTNLFHCEIADFPRKVLKHHFPESVSYDDITKTDFTPWAGKVGVLSGGFPCQDASAANQWGKVTGIQGARTGLVEHMFRVIEQTGPIYVVAENVVNLLRTNNGEDFAYILSRLSTMGYNAEWRDCYASEVGAPHHRPRLYLVAYSNSLRVQRDQSFFSLLHEAATPKPRTLSGTNVEINADHEWLQESPIYNVVDGVPEGLAESIKAGGNAIVPQVALQIFRSIQLFENEQN